MALLALYGEVLNLDGADLALYGIYDARNSRTGGGGGTSKNTTASGSVKGQAASGKASR